MSNEQQRKQSKTITKLETCVAGQIMPHKKFFCHLCQPERLRDEEIDYLEQLLQSQALRPNPQSTTNIQEESPVPSNCFKFQSRVFGESRRPFLLFLFSVSVTDIKIWLILRWLVAFVRFTSDLGEETMLSPLYDLILAFVLKLRAHCITSCQLRKHDRKFAIDFLSARLSLQVVQQCVKVKSRSFDIICLFFATSVLHGCTV